MLEYIPQILFVTSIILLKKRWLYIIGCAVNTFINILLKSIIRQKRPGAYTNIIPYDNYGMPSGHAQFAMFSTIFISTLKNKKITLFYLLCCFLTMYQRVAYNYHTLEQVLAGFAVGAIVAYLFLKLVLHLR